ncbi:MAG: DUF3817 domain-containing protein [Chitinophagaceae bacterium]|nr:DUF3817 domain-containing protein [Chitinophagaceae bacterium]
MKSAKTFKLFRNIANIEGISYLVLLFIAMPLKYFANFPMAVTVVGGLHGVLFVAFVVLSWETKREYNKGWGWFIKAFISSLLPFGTFIMDKQWKREQDEATKATA